MNRVTYTGLLYLAMPFIFLRLMQRARQTPDYRRRWQERLGCYAEEAARFQRKARCLVFHAVSVGEVHAAVPLIRTILQEEPDCSVVVTTSTPTGSARVRKLFGDQVFHIYLPYDLPAALRRFLDYVRPDLLVVMETELWPNLIDQCHRRGIRLLLANARLSARSARGYARLGRLTGKMLQQLDKVAAQSSADGQRLLELGLPAQRLQITGSMKFDLEIPAAQVEAGRHLNQVMAGTRPVLIAASTREGEEEKVLKAFCRILQRQPEVLLILVPRHPERFEHAYRLCAGLGLQVRRRSEGRLDGRFQVLLGDSMGEMMLYYAASDIAFVGGSLVNTGCQNILEPAALGLPVLTGPSLYNFEAISEQLVEAGALRVVQDEEALAATVLELLTDHELCREMAAAAAGVVEENRGAAAKLVGMTRALLRKAPAPLPRNL